MAKEGVSLLPYVIDCTGKEVASLKSWRTTSPPKSSPVVSYFQAIFSLTYSLCTSFAAINEEDSKDISDTASSCSGHSSCCTEQSYHLMSWKGTLSTSWQSLASTSSTLMVPALTASSHVASSLAEDASSLSDASGISLNSSSGINTGTPPLNAGGASSKKNLTALILETVEEHGFRAHYLIPKQLAKKVRLRRLRGVKLHVSNEHLFMAKHIKR